MILQLFRRQSSSAATIGELYVDGSTERRCFTLEDPVREIAGQPVSAWKIPGNTAIPRGRYEVAMTWSPRFQRILPLLMNVPGFVGVRIHAGNTSADTEGCVLVGMSKDGNFLLMSRMALADIKTLILAAIERDEQVFIEVKGG